MNPADQNEQQTSNRTSKTPENKPLASRDIMKYLNLRHRPALRVLK